MCIQINTQISYYLICFSAFVEPKHNSAIKFRAGNVVLNILNDEDTSVKLQLAKKLQQEFPVLIDASRLSSHSLWTSKLSSILKNRESEDKPFDASSGKSLYRLHFIIQFKKRFKNILLLVCRCKWRNSIYYAQSINGFMQNSNIIFAVASDRLRRNGRNIARGNKQWCQSDDVQVGKQ